MPPPRLSCLYLTCFQIRARLEKKLQNKQKASFAFNFAVDSDTDDLQGREQGSFRFDFNTPSTTGVDRGAKAIKTKHSGGDDNPRAAEDVVVQIEEKRAQPNTKNKSKKKGAGKKKKGGKRKGKSAEKEGIRDLTGGQQPQQDLGVTELPGSSTMGDGGGQTNNCCLPRVVERESKPICGDAGQGSATSDGVEEKSNSETLRPPPGFTLESWKDPALSGEERRRRRFGSGVRNMAAIQRSCDARREMVAGGEPEPEEFLGRHGGLVRPDRDRAPGHGPVQAAVPGDTAGGPSVFSFGFDIGISFNGGS